MHETSENEVILQERPAVRPLVPPESAAALSGCPKLAGALALTRARCKGTSKDSTNVHHNYRYASADEVIATASAALAGSGLALIRAEELSVVGADQHAFYALDRVLILSHSSGEFVALEVKNWPVILERGRPLDKAYAIALTSSLAYKFTDLLQMPRGDQFDDVAPRTTDTRRRRTRPGAGASQSPPAAAPKGGSQEAGTHAPRRRRHLSRPPRCGSSAPGSSTTSKRRSTARPHG